MNENQNQGYDSTGQNPYTNRPRSEWDQAPPREENKKLLAGLLAIFLGGLGIHKFILGYTKEGVIQIIITVVTCGIGSLIGLVEGIIYLTKTDEEFYQTYQVGRKGWF